LKRGALRLEAIGLAALLLAACGEDEPARTPTRTPSEGATRAPRVSSIEQEAGLDQCGTFLERLTPTQPATFSQLMEACSGLYAVRACSDALHATEFSRDRVHAACSAAYCPEMTRNTPSFCTHDVPTDAAFLLQFAEFSEAALRIDLARPLGREGANEIATLMGQLIRDQATRE
jgi:hypothetical protein